MIDDSNDYPVVGRSPEIDLELYGKTINGRRVIDYEKLKLGNPLLYEKVLADEHESNRRDLLGEDNA